MFKLYRYELRHYLTDKLFLILAVITCCFCWFTLSTETILGVANTAPFSPWSFGAYTASVLPFALACLLSLIATMYSPDERLAETITGATPTDGKARAGIRLAAICTGFLAIMAAALILGVVFLYQVFGQVYLLEFAAPFALAVVPSLLLAVGLGMNLGRISSGALYGLMALLMLFGLVGSGLTLPSVLDVFGARFFSTFPKTLDTLDPAFTVPALTLAVRLGFMALGLGGTLAALFAFGRAKGG